MWYVCFVACVVLMMMTWREENNDRIEKQTKDKEKERSKKDDKYIHAVKLGNTNFTSLNQEFTQRTHTWGKLALLACWYYCCQRSSG
jgi:hypothetical protein